MKKKQTHPTTPTSGETTQTKPEDITQFVREHRAAFACLVDEAEAEIKRMHAKIDNWADINAAAGREIKRLTWWNRALQHRMQERADEIKRLRVDLANAFERERGWKMRALEQERKG